MYALQRAFRSLSTTVQPPKLTKFALHPPKKVEVGFADGSVFNLSAEFLRVHSPAVDSKIRSVGGEKVIYGRRHVGIMSAEAIGNYGVKIDFDDLHKTGGCNCSGRTNEDCRNPSGCWAGSGTGSKWNSGRERGSESGGSC